MHGHHYHVQPRSKAASKEFPTPLTPSTAAASASSDELPTVQLVPASQEDVVMTEQEGEEVLHRDLASDSEEEVSSVDSSALATARAVRARQVAAATPMPPCSDDCFVIFCARPGPPDSA